MKQMTTTTKRFMAMGLATFGMVGLAGCHIDMWIQPKVKPQQASEFFGDGQASRLPITGTVARGQLKENDALYTGYTSSSATGKLVETIPVPVTKETLKRGQERFNIYCTPCHGKIGDGNGMIAMRGFALRRPPGNYHTDRLRKMPVGHFYDVIVNGYGSMYSYASRIQDVNDRWAIVAYIRVLQLSQGATANDVPADKRAMLDGGTAGDSGHSEGAPSGSEQKE